jgi:hypothetical protein
MESRARDIESDVIHAAYLAWRRASGVLSRLIGENGEEAPVSGLEVKMVLFGIPEIRLLEYEWHAQNALPEIDRALFRRADDRDVMHPLDLNLLHARLL